MQIEKIKNDKINTIGKNIREARLKANIGQTELVSRLQLLDQLKGIKQVLDITYEELLDK